MKRKMICPLCKKEIPYDKKQQGGMHIQCSETEIDVFYVGLKNDPKNGYYEYIFKNLDVSDDCFLETRKIKAGKYFSAEEFQGF